MHTKWVTVMISYISAAKHKKTEPEPQQVASGKSFRRLDPDGKATPPGVAPLVIKSTEKGMYQLLAWLPT